MHTLKTLTVGAAGLVAALSLAACDSMNSGGAPSPSASTPATGPAAAATDQANSATDNAAASDTARGGGNDAAKNRASTGASTQDRGGSPSPN
jgi:hypothetical protein